MATNDTLIQQLIINEISEDKLKELDTSGTVPTNELFLTPESSSNNATLLSLPVGMIISSAIIQDNAGLHLLDGASLSQNGVYANFCSWLKAKIVSSPSSVPTATIEQYASDMQLYGQCGKFVINNTNNVLTSGEYSVEANSIKLPTITRIIQGLSVISDIGNIVEAGLPNITGTLQSTRRQTSSSTITTGAFEAVAGTGVGAGYDNNITTGNLNFNASRSNSIYGNSDTVQPITVKYPYYIVVGTVAKTDILVDINEIVSDLSQKVEQSDFNKVSNSTYVLDRIVEIENGVSSLQVNDFYFANYDYKVEYYLAIGGGGSILVAPTINNTKCQANVVRGSLKISRGTNTATGNMSENFGYALVDSARATFNMYITGNITVRCRGEFKIFNPYGYNNGLQWESDLIHYREGSFGYDLFSYLLDLKNSVASDVNGINITFPHSISNTSEGNKSYIKIYKRVKNDES